MKTVILSPPCIADEISDVIDEMYNVFHVDLVRMSVFDPVWDMIDALTDLATNSVYFHFDGREWSWPV